MRISAGVVANGAAWLVLGVAFAAAVVIADVLGFVGLFVLGAATWLVCTRAALSEQVPTWPVPAADSHGARLPSPEQRQAEGAAREAALLSFRFYGRCGMAMAALGAAGFAWQCWWSGLASPP